MNKQLIEAMAAERGWVVKFAQDGTPSFFYPIYKCTSKSLDASLPDRTHPAFIVNGQELDRILVGVYKGSEANGAVHSLPMRPPRASIGSDEIRNMCLAAGPGFTAKTVAVSGLLLLLAKKNNWKPKGNNYYGVDYRDGTYWREGQNYNLNGKIAFQGWEYTSKAAHLSSLANKPDVAPDLWTKGKRIGGTMDPSRISASNPNGYHTLSGSGPLSWNLDGTINGIADLNGNVFENDYGYRVVGGELQVMANNDAMHPDADLSASSLAWRAILPNAANDSHTLVAPGTPGTLKWDIPSGSPVLSKTITTRDVDKYVGFTSITKAADLPYVPALVKELGIFPSSPDSVTQGVAYYTNTEGAEFIPRRGGGFNNSSDAGLGCVSALSPRGAVYANFGVRPAFVETL